MDRGNVERRLVMKIMRIAKEGYGQTESFHGSRCLHDVPSAPKRIDRRYSHRPKRPYDTRNYQSMTNLAIFVVSLCGVAGYDDTILDSLIRRGTHTFVLGTHRMKDMVR